VVVTASTNRPNASKTRPRPISGHRLRLVAAARWPRHAHIWASQLRNWATALLAS